jgi:hypothetical protein
MVIPLTDSDPAAAVGHIIQPQAHHLTRSQTTVEHQQEDRQIAQRSHALAADLGDLRGG